MAAGDEDETFVALERELYALLSKPGTTERQAGEAFKELRLAGVGQPALASRVAAAKDAVNRFQLHAGAGKGAAGGAGTGHSGASAAEMRERAGEAAGRLKEGTTALTAAAREVEEMVAVGEASLQDLAAQRDKLRSISGKVSAVHAKADEANTITKRMSSWFNW